MHAMCFCRNSHMVHMWSQSSSGTPKVSFSCDPENASSKLEMRMVVTCILRVLRLTWRDSSFFVIPVCFMMSSSQGFWTLDLASWAVLPLFRRLSSSPLHSKMQCDSQAIKVPQIGCESVVYPAAKRCMKCHASRHTLSSCQVVKRELTIFSPQQSRSVYRSTDGGTPAIS